MDGNGGKEHFKQKSNNHNHVTYALHNIKAAYSIY